MNIGIPEWIQQPRPEFAVLELDHVLSPLASIFLKSVHLPSALFAKLTQINARMTKQLLSGGTRQRLALPRISTCVILECGSIGSLGIGQNSTALWGVREPIPSVWFGWLCPYALSS